MGTVSQLLDGKTQAQDIILKDINGDVFGGITSPLTIQQADLNADIDEVSVYEGVISKRVDEVSSTITYIGEAVAGSAEGSSVWRVRKIDFTNPISIKWAGTGIYNQVWSNRAALTYN